MTSEILQAFVAAGTWTTGTPYPCNVQGTYLERYRQDRTTLPDGAPLDVITSHTIHMPALVH